MHEGLITKPQLAVRLGVCIGTIDKWMAEKRIPAYKLGINCVRYDFSAVMDALEKFNVPANRRHPRPLRRRRRTRLLPILIQSELILEHPTEQLLLPGF